MTYYERYVALGNEDKIKEQARADKAKAILFNPDTLKAIEEVQSIEEAEKLSVAQIRGETE